MMPSTFTCQNCGADNKPQATYCRSCGQSLQVVKPTIYNSATGQLLTNTTLKQRYRIITPVGKGGMGAVYKAEDTQLGNRLVALKEMSQSGLNPQEQQEAADAFKREAMMLARLHHPNLPSIFDHFEENGRWYLVMSFIEGDTLENYLSKAQNRRLSLNETLQVGTQLCTVLGYLHNQQPAIIFRDLKPANIMRTPDGHIYLIDFGIARHFKPGQARDTAYYGSMGYAPPEQYGQAQTNARSDIYSLGVVFYEMITGYNPSMTPFQFPPVQAQVPNVPLMLATLIAQMLELDKNKRPTDVLTISQKLQGLISAPRGLALPAPLLPTVAVSRPPFPPPGFPSPRSRRKLHWIALLVSVVGIVVVTIGVISLTSFSQTPSSGAPNQIPPTSTSNIGIAPGGTIPSRFIVKPGMTWRGTLRTCGVPACGVELKILIIDPSGNFTGTWANDYSSPNGTNYTDVENVQGNITGDHISWTGTGRIKGNLIIPNAHHEGTIYSDGHIHGDGQDDSFDLNLV